jgi:hypothetical protein
VSLAFSAKGSLFSDSVFGDGFAPTCEQAVHPDAAVARTICSLVKVGASFWRVADIVFWDFFIFGGGGGGGGGGELAFAFSGWTAVHQIFSVDADTYSHIVCKLLCVRVCVCVVVRAHMGVCVSTGFMNLAHVFHRPPLPFLFTYVFRMATGTSL